MKILITGAGGAAAVSVWKSLHNDHQLYMADIDPCAAGLYLVPPDQRLIIPSGNSDCFTDMLFQTCKKLQIEVLIPTVDSELLPLAIEANRFFRIGVRLPLSSAETLKICRDKYMLLTFFKDKTFIPKTTLLTKATVSEVTQFPLFSKPRLGAGSQNANEIKDAKALAQLPLDESYILQELLPGDEYSVDVYIHSNGHALAAVPRLRMKIDSGIAVAARTQMLPDLIDQALAVAQQVGLRYVANIQFKKDTKGNFKLLEINPRFPGTLPLTAEAGIDIPTLMIKDLQNESLPTSLMPFQEIMVVRYWTEQFCSLEAWENLCSQKQALG